MNAKSHTSRLPLFDHNNIKGFNSPVHYRRTKYRNLFLRNSSTPEQNNLEVTYSSKHNDLKTLKKHVILNRRITPGSHQGNVVDEDSNDSAAAVKLRAESAANQLNKNEEERYAAYITQRKKQVESFANEDDRDKRNRILTMKKLRAKKINKRHNLDSPSAINSVEYFNYHLQHPEAVEDEQDSLLEQKGKGMKNKGVMTRLTMSL